MTPRPPTHPGIPITLEGLAVRQDALDMRLENHAKAVRGVLQRMETSEKQMVELRGIDGRGGYLAWQREEQTRSAGAQGARIGNVEAALAVTNQDLRVVREQQIDMKARWGAGIAVVMALLSLITEVVRIFKGG